MTTEQCQKSLFLIFLVIRCNQAFGIGQILGSQLFLSFKQTLYQRTELLKQLILTFRNRTRNNQRSTSIVNQYRVHLIDNSIIMFTLHQVFWTDSHIVTQVIETEFIIRTESDIGHISSAACIRIGLVFINTVHTQSMELIQWPHPFRVTF